MRARSNERHTFPPPEQRNTQYSSEHLKNHFDTLLTEDRKKAVTFAENAQRKTFNDPANEEINKKFLDYARAVLHSTARPDKTYIAPDVQRVGEKFPDNKGWNILVSGLQRTPEPRGLNPEFQPIAPHSGEKIETIPPPPPLHKHHTDTQPSRRLTPETPSVVLGNPIIDQQILLSPLSTDERQVVLAWLRDQPKIKGDVDVSDYIKKAAASQTRGLRWLSKKQRTLANALRKLSASLQRRTNDQREHLPLGKQRRVLGLRKFEQLMEPAKLTKHEKDELFFWAQNQLETTALFKDNDSSLFVDNFRREVFLPQIQHALPNTRGALKTGLRKLQTYITNLYRV